MNTDFLNEFIEMGFEEDIYSNIENLVRRFFKSDSNLGVVRV